MKFNAQTLIGIMGVFALMYAMTNSATQSQTAYSTRSRVAFVDIQAITEKALFIQSLKISIESEFAGKIKQYKDKQQEYAELVDEIKRQKTVLAESAVDKKYKQAFLLKAQLDEEKYKIDKFLKESDDKKTPALDRILAVVREIAQEEGYEVVFKREMLLYGGSSVDISDRVIARLNATVDTSSASSSTSSRKKTSY